MPSGLGGAPVAVDGEGDERMTKPERLKREKESDGCRWFFIRSSLMEITV